MTWLFLAGAVLVAGAGVAYRRRKSLHGGLSDEAVRAIEEGRPVELDEPLDLDEVAEEEERFWSESWDQPEPW